MRTYNVSDAARKQFAGSFFVWGDFASDASMPGDIFEFQLGADGGVVCAMPWEVTRFNGIEQIKGTSMAETLRQAYNPELTGAYWQDRLIAEIAKQAVRSGVEFHVYFLRVIA